MKCGHNKAHTRTSVEQATKYHITSSKTSIREENIGCKSKYNEDGNETVTKRHREYILPK
jgi:hypothetical protein